MKGGRGGGPGAHIDGFINDTNRSEFSFDDMGGDANFSMSDSGGVDFEFNESSFEAEFDSGFEENSGKPRTPVETDPRATKLMNEAMAGIQETYEVYVGYAGPDADLLDVNATIDSFNAPRVRRLAQNARDPLERATEFAPEGQKNFILSLVQVTVFLEDMARVREALMEAHDEFRYAVDRLYAESTLRAERANLRLRDARNRAKSLFKPLKNEIDAKAVAVFTPLRKTYEDKIDQVRAELDAFRNIKSGVKSAANGIKKFRRGVPAFYDRDYRKALSSLETAEFRFSNAVSGFAVVDDSTGMRAKASEVAAVMAALRSAAGSLSEAATVKVDDEPQPRFFEARRAAEDAIEGNRIASDMRTASQIIT